MEHFHSPSSLPDEQRIQYNTLFLHFVPRKQHTIQCHSKHTVLIRGVGESKLAGCKIPQLKWLDWGLLSTCQRCLSHWPYQSFPHQVSGIHKPIFYSYHTLVCELVSCPGLFFCEKWFLASVIMQYIHDVLHLCTTHIFLSSNCMALASCYVAFILISVMHGNFWTLRC